MISTQAAPWRQKEDEITVKGRRRRSKQFVVLPHVLVAVLPFDRLNSSQSEQSNLLQVWADVTNDLLSQNNGGGADLLGITGYMHPPGRMCVCFAIGPSALILPHQK